MFKDNILPIKVTDPFRFAENAIHLEGVLSIEKMERLCSSLHSNTGAVSVDLQFGVDEQKIPFIQSQFSTRIVLQCQRCLEPFSYDIADDVLMGIVRTELEAEKLPSNYNPVIVNTDGSLIIQDLIEDELLVSIPIVPMHDPKECGITTPLSIDSENTAETQKENPFKVIELLRSKHNSK